jgi:hypothetical protein
MMNAAIFGRNVSRSGGERQVQTSRHLSEELKLIGPTFSSEIIHCKAQCLTKDDEASPYVRKAKDLYHLRGRV